MAHHLIPAGETRLRLPDSVDAAGIVRYDFISHLSQRFGLSQEIVEATLGEWLLDTAHDNRQWQRELARR